MVDRKAYHTKLEFDWADGEALYGLGSHEEGMFNLRGQHQYLYQQNMKAVVPVLVSTRGYGIVMDSCSLMTFHDDAFGSYLWSDVDDELDFYFLYGPEFDQIVHEIRTLTGHSPMLPKWAFGYIQSKERYVTQDELLSIVREYRRRELPLDGIVLDWKSWTGDLWGQKTFDPDRFPNPRPDDRRVARSPCPPDGFHLANHASRRRELAGNERPRSPVGQPGHLQCLQRSSPRLLLGAGQPGPVLTWDRRLVVRLHRALRS